MTRVYSEAAIYRRALFTVLRECRVEGLFIPHPRPDGVITDWLSPYEYALHLKRTVWAERHRVYAEVDALLAREDGSDEDGYPWDTL